MNIKTQQLKMSEMVLQFADDYISMGETTDERQNLLNSACSAWNMSLLSTHERSRNIKKYLKEYKRYNSDIDDQDCEDMKENLEKLISEKERLFPDESKKIITAEIKIINGKEHYNVLFMREK